MSSLCCARPLLRRLPLHAAAASASASSSNAVALSLTRTYVTRAHPKPATQLPILEAIDQVLEGITERKAKRVARWDRYGEKIAARKGFQIDGPYRNQDETIELALNLNLDPRKPGQALRGSCSLPHGTGKTVSVVVFTNDAALAKSLQEQGSDNENSQGAVVAGGDALIADLASGAVPLTFDRALATPDMMASLSSIARLLGPRGLMPNAKVGTIVPPAQLPDVLKQQQAGQIQYRTDKSGIVHAGVAKGSFTKEQIVDNIQAFMNTLQEVKPDSFGKGKKKGGGGGKKGGGSNKNAKYYLKAHVTSTQGKGVPVDLRTVDPTSTFFMGEIEE